jgi:hypothetical protein
MKKIFYEVFLFILNWFLLLSGVLVSGILWSYLFYKTDIVEITPKKFILPIVFGLLGAVYFISSSKKQKRDQDNQNTN